ncbi:MAG: hypothetical protein KatS3mg110_1511 [Pirellulaceae bacterium]|nr:MAG: hypothetical protein KatS3mg110_1511 [Pirellulaceae bacterium]
MSEDWQDDRDPLLDAALSELLGGEQPPDLTARIVAALAQQQKGVAAEPSGSASRLPNGTASPGSRERRRITAEAGAHRGGRPRGVPVWATAACVLLVGSLLGLTALWVSVRQNVRQPTAENLPVGGRHESSSNVAQQQPAGRVSEPGVPKPAAPQTIVDDVANREPTPLEAPFGHAGNASRPAVSTPAGKPQRIEPWPDERIVAELDRRLSEKLLELRLVAAGPATEAEFCRRAFVRLLGRIPTVEELKAYLADERPDKRRRLIERLVDSTPYRDEFAAHWALFWTNTLLGRTAGTQPGDLVDRDSFMSFLEKSFLDDLPWNELVVRLLTSAGTNRPGSEDFRPEVNFWVAHHSSDGTVETAAVMRLFAGRRYQCAQCHNHPFDETLSQKQYWQVNALLRQLRLVREGEQVRVVDADAASDAVFFEELSGMQRAVYPALPDGTPLPPSGKVADVRRRERLAQWIAASDELARVTVNRVWAHFLGYGFTRPVDELSPANPVSHPEVLQLLADQWVARGYQMRDLVRWIALSEAFGRSSRITQDNIADMPEQGQTPWFSRYYTRLIEPEAVFDSLRLVADARRSLGPSPDRRQFLAQFVDRMGTDDNEERETFRGDIRQALLLMTGSVMQRAMSSEEGAVLRHVIESSLSPDEKITHLFLAAIARPPTARELQQGRKMLQENPEEIALQDIWWALLNSNEFILDH